MTTKPKTNNIYFAIIKCKDLAKDTIEYHYSFIEYKDEWVKPEMEGYNMEVVAWCELENPEPHFVDKSRILTM